MNNQEHLKCNILNFNWPAITPTFYLSLQDIESSHPIHSSKFSQQLKDAFPNENLSKVEHIYTTFTEVIPNAPTIKINLRNPKELRIYKQYLKYQIKNHFLNQSYIVSRNFVRDVQVWIPSKKDNTNDYNLYYKFSFKIQFAKLSELPELIVSYDGTSKVLTKSIKDIEETEYIKKCINGQKLFNYQMELDSPEKEEFFHNIDITQAFPLFNLKLARSLDIPIPEIDRSLNKYQTYVGVVSKFAEKFLFTDDFKKIIPFTKEEFIDVPKNRINHISPQKGLLQFGNDQNGFKTIHLQPKIALNKYNPFKGPKSPNNNKYLLIYHKSHKDNINKFQDNLENGVVCDKKYFAGFEDYLNLKLSYSNEHSIVYDDENNPLPTIIEKLNTLEFDHEKVRYVAIYFSPFDKYTPNPEEREIYIRIKELFLNENIVTQVVDYQKMVENISNQYNFQFTLQNMSLAIYAKLTGVPWKLAITDKMELVIGVGAFTNQDENKRYIASAFSFQNNGLFRSFEYFYKNETSLLAGSICRAINHFTSVAKADKVVIHFYKEMSFKELQPIREAMNKLDLKVPLYILNINKTEEEDLIAYDVNWGQKLMPLSGTYINISERQYLLFNNNRFDNNTTYRDTDGYHFPIKIRISSPDEDAFEDINIIDELLVQVYQFSKLYWKSLRQQNVPVTIKYPEMVAQLAPKFNDHIDDEVKDKLWFL